MSRIRSAFLAAVLVASSIGCRGPVDVEKVPIGTAVEVTRQDGGVVRGTLTARDDSSLKMAVGPATRSIPRAEVESVAVVEGTTEPALPAAARFREYTVPEGTALALRLDSSIGSNTSHPEDAVEAILTKAVVVDGVEVLPADSILKGVVTTAVPSGRVSGTASLGVMFQSVSIETRHETYGLSAGLHRAAASTRTTDAKKIGIPAAGGAIVGAILGGKKGAAVGATIGGGAGTAVVLTTAGADIHMPRGTEVSVTLDHAMDVRVPIAR